MTRMWLSYKVVMLDTLNRGRSCHIYGPSYALKYPIYRSVAAVHVQLLGAAYSLHSSLREARLCYLRALVGKQVFFIGDDGLSESMVTPVIPSGYTLETWWSMCWKDWDRNDDIPVPTIRP